MPIINNKTRIVIIYLLKEKRQALYYLKEYVNRVKAEGHPILGIRFDNRGEFKSKELIAFLSQESINNELTASYSPKLNVVAERFNRTLVSKVRLIIKDA